MYKNTGLKRAFALVFALALLASLALPAAAASAATAGRVSTSSLPLNVRAAASTSSSVVASLAKGSYVTLVSESGSWYRVQYADGKYGYCAKAYITALGGEELSVRLTSGTLNVRSGAGTGYQVAASLSNGASVVRLAQSGSWSKVLCRGTLVGWVASAYLSEAASAAVSSSVSGVSLSVPSYKQYDSRWAAVEVGSSGRTINSIGCAVTSLAMTESFRTGTAVTPLAMEAKLSFTSGGAVYWPDSYSQYSASDWLSKAASLLRSGKPVIAGVKNASGGTHYVVITGYTGSGTAASQFLINDPASQTRQTLSALLSAYPYFIKILYY